MIPGKMCILDCSPSALKLLHNSPEFMPFVIFIAAPGMDQLKQLYAERRAAGGSQKNLAVSFDANRFDFAVLNRLFCVFVTLSILGVFSLTVKALSGTVPGVRGLWSR